MNSIAYALKVMGAEKKNILLFALQIVVALLIIDFSLNFQASARTGLDDIDALASSIPGAFNYFEVSDFTIQEDVRRLPEYPARIADLYTFLTENALFDVIFAGFSTGISYGSLDPATGFPEYYIDNYSINEAWMEYLPMPDISEGRWLEEGDFEPSGPVPLVLGSSYKDLFAIGDVIFDLYGLFHNEYRVVGFFAEGETIYAENRFQVCDGLSIVPLFSLQDMRPNFLKHDRPEFVYFEDMAFNALIVPKNGSHNADAIKSEIQSKFEQDGYFKLQFNDIAAEIERDRNVYAVLSERIQFVSYMIISFTILSILSVQLWRIIRRKKSYGIMIMSGATRPQIAQTFFAENSITLALSLFVFHVLRVLIYQPQFYFPELSIAGLVLALGLSLVPYISLSSREIIFFIKRDE